MLRVLLAQNNREYSWTSEWNIEEWISHFNLFTPKSDQFQISPAASPETLHHTVWRTWFFITYSDEGYYQFSLPHWCISLQKVGRMYILNLGVKGLNVHSNYRSHTEMVMWRRLSISLSVSWVCQTRCLKFVHMDSRSNTRSVQIVLPRKWSILCQIILGLCHRPPTQLIWAIMWGAVPQINYASDWPVTRINWIRIKRMVPPSLLYRTLVRRWKNF